MHTLCYMYYVFLCNSVAYGTMHSVTSEVLPFQGIDFVHYVTTNIHEYVAGLDHARCFD